MKKIVSILLSLIIIICAFLIVPVSAATIDDNKAYVKVNDQYYEVEKGEVFNYVYTLKYTKNKISSININIDYDTEGLDFVPVYDKYGDVDMMYHFPNIYGGSVFNSSVDGKLLFNYSSVNGVRFYEDDMVVFTCDFEVTADTGIYEIGSNLITLADSDLNYAVYEGEKIDEFEAEQTLPQLTPVEIVDPTEVPSEEATVIPTEEETNVVEEPTQEETQEPTITPSEPTEPPSEPLRYNTIYLINSAQWSVPCVYSYTQLADDPYEYVETAPWPGEIMVKTDSKAPNGANVYAIVLQDIYELVVFNDAGSNYTDDLMVRPDMYYDNKENKWYSDLSEVPTEIPTEAPTAEPTEAPTQKDDTEGLFVCADGQLYEVEKGDVFTYTYCLSVDESLKISSLDAHTYYDASGLTFVPIYDKYGDLDVKTMFPILTTGVVYNVESEGKVLYNYSYTTGVRLPDNSEIFRGQFVVTADSGVYEINTKLVTLADSNMNHLVEDSEIIGDFGQSSKVEEVAPDEPTEIPTTEPTIEPTEAPTQAPTAEPTEIPTEKDESSTVYLINSAKWSNAYVYVWFDNNEQLALWPGVQMTKVGSMSDGVHIYSYTFDKMYDYIIFNSSAGNQSDDLEFVPNGCYDNLKGEWVNIYDYKPEEPSEDSGDEQAPDVPTVLPTQQETESPTQIKPGSTPGDQEVEPTEAEPSEPVVEPTEPILEPTEQEDPTEQDPLPTEPVVNPTEPVELLIGDVNGDGEINIFDVTYIQCHIAEWEKYKVLDERQIIVADTTFDGNINIFDATRIQMYIAEYFTEFTK